MNWRIWELRNCWNFTEHIFVSSLEGKPKIIFLTAGIAAGMAALLLSCLPMLLVIIFLLLLVFVPNSFTSLSFYLFLFFSLALCLCSCEKIKQHPRNGRRGSGDNEETRFSVPPPSRNSSSSSSFSLASPRLAVPFSSALFSFILHVAVCPVSKHTHRHMYMLLYKPKLAIGVVTIKKRASGSLTLSSSRFLPFFSLTPSYSPGAVWATNFFFYSSISCSFITLRLFIFYPLASWETRRRKISRRNILRSPDFSFVYTSVHFYMYQQIYMDVPYRCIQVSSRSYSLALTL